MFIELKGDRLPLPDSAPLIASRMGRTLRSEALRRLELMLQQLRSTKLISK